jgi:hypothetical protein
MNGAARGPAALLLLLLVSGETHGATAAGAAPSTAASDAKSAAVAAASTIPDELVFLSPDDANAVVATGRPGCAKGRMVVTYQPDTGFLEDGAVYRTEEVGFALGEAARAGRVSCLIVEAAAYDRAMFVKLRDDYAAPNGVSLMWIPKSP